MNHELSPRGWFRITKRTELRIGVADHSDPYLAPVGATLVLYPAQTYLPECLTVVVEEEGRFPLTCSLPMPGVLALLRVEADQAIEALRAVPLGTLSSPRRQLEAYNPLVALEMTIRFLLGPEMRPKLARDHENRLRVLRREVGISLLGDD